MQYCVKVGSSAGKPFETKTGSPQGDCLSAILFAFYFAISLEYKVHMKDHSYALPSYLADKIPPVLGDHNYAITPIKAYEICKETMNIDTQYADHSGNAIIGLENNTKHHVNYLKATIPGVLKKRQLFCNKAKDEEYAVNHKNRNGTWKKCKYLATLLDTHEDIKRRKFLAIESAKSLDNIWKSNLPICLKMKIFDCLVKSVFLYNSELWTATTAINKKIDCIQRRLLRLALNIKYPRIISNNELMDITKQETWSKSISTQRIRWLGHAFRLPEECPARKAIEEFERPVKKPRGRPITTWINIVKKQLNDVGITWEQGKQLAKDRKQWRDIVNIC